MPLVFCFSNSFTHSVHGWSAWVHRSQVSSGGPSSSCRTQLVPCTPSTHLYLHPDTWAGGQGTGGASGETRVAPAGCPSAARHDTEGTTLFLFIFYFLLPYWHSYRHKQSHSWSSSSSIPSRSLDENIKCEVLKQSNNESSLKFTDL